MDQHDEWTVDIQDVARNYCCTFHAQRTECSEYEPGSHHALDALRHTAADVLAGSRLPEMPCGLLSCCMSMGISPPTISTTYTGSGSKLKSLLTCSSNRDHQ